MVVVVVRRDGACENGGMECFDYYVLGVEEESVTEDG